jgi:purine nucleoside phosphorylase
MNKARVLDLMIKAYIIFKASLYLVIPSKLEGAEFLHKPSIGIANFAYSGENKQIEQYLNACLSEAGFPVYTLNLEGVSDERRAVAAAKALGIEKVISGSHSLSRGVESVEARCIDVNTDVVDLSTLISGNPRTISVADMLSQRLSKALASVTRSEESQMASYPSATEYEDSEIELVLP